MYLHNRQIVHFDLKSANLLVTVRDKVPCVKIADMGLAKAKTQTYVTGQDTAAILLRCSTDPESTHSTSCSVCHIHGRVSRPAALLLYG